MPVFSNDSTAQQQTMCRTSTSQQMDCNEASPKFVACTIKIGSIAWLLLAVQLNMQKKKKLQASIVA